MYISVSWCHGINGEVQPANVSSHSSAVDATACNVGSQPNPTLQKNSARFKQIFPSSGMYLVMVLYLYSICIHIVFVFGAPLTPERWRRGQKNFWQSIPAGPVWPQHLPNCDLYLFCLI